MTPPTRRRSRHLGSSFQLAADSQLRPANPNSGNYHLPDPAKQALMGDIAVARHRPATTGTLLIP